MLQLHAAGLSQRAIADRLSLTMTNKLTKAAGVTRDRYLAAIATARRCRALLDELFADLDIMLAQRIYNNSIWPNPVVAKLTAVEPVQP